MDSIPVIMAAGTLALFGIAVLGFILIKERK